MVLADSTTTRSGGRPLDIAGVRA